MNSYACSDCLEMQEKHLRAPQSSSAQTLEANRIINMESTITLHSPNPSALSKNDDEALGSLVVHPHRIYLFQGNKIFMETMLWFSLLC